MSFEKKQQPCSLRLRTISSHCWILSEALSGINEYHYQLEDVVSYLQFASGIQGVKFSTWDFDLQGGYCETADDFRDEQDKLWSELAHQLSVFLFTWAAVEAYRDVLPLVDSPKVPGKKPRQIDKLCFYLSQNFTGPLPEGYLHLLNILKKVIGRSEIGRQAGKKTVLPSYLKESAEGLYLVYEFRNAFAHGDFTAPLPDDTDPKKHPDIILVILATRIVTVTLQMLTLCLCSKDLIIAVPSLSLYADDGNATTLGEVFLKLHLKGFPGGASVSSK